MERTGRCLCGAVSYTAKSPQPKIAACNCGMCRRWSGGPYLSFSAHEVEWSGDQALTTYASSEWAERGFCSVCGSALFYRVTKDGPLHGAMHVAFGTLDDQSGFEMKMEFYIDLKPPAYAFDGEHQRLTEAEVMALFTKLDA